MAYLEENEWMLLNEIAYNISFIYSLDDMRVKILKWIKLLIDYDGAMFSLVGDHGMRIYNSVGSGIEEKYIKKYDDVYMKDNPLHWIIASGKSAAYRDSSLISEKTLQNNDFYKAFYAPNRFMYTASMNIVFREDVVGIISFFKEKEHSDFSDRDLFILDQLQKHFAYRLYYEAKKGDTRYFYAKGYKERLCKEYGLTTREAELMDYAVKGLSNDEIASRMNISIHTVKKHFHSLYMKMNVKNRVQLLQCLPLSTNKINFDEI